MKKTVTIPYKAKPNTQLEEHLMHNINQTLAIPETGGLEPDPAIRNHIMAHMATPKPSWLATLKTIPNRFPIRVPIYQAAFAMAIVLFAVVGTFRSTQPNSAAQNPQSPAVADTGQTQRDTPRTSSSDTLAYHPMVSVLFASSPIDSL